MRPQYLLVLTSRLTDPMMKVLYALLSDAGIPREDTEVLYLLGDEQPEGASDRATVSQLQRTAPAFRDAVEQTTPRCIIAFGPEAFHALTGRSWKIDEARGYIVTMEDRANVPTRVQVQNGVYKTGPKKGTPKMAWKVVSMPPPTPVIWEYAQPVEYAGRWAYIVPCISVRQYKKLRMRPVTAMMAALENAVAYGRGDKEDKLDSWVVGAPGETLVLPAGAPAAFDLEAPRFSDSIERLSVAFPDTIRPYYAASLPWGREEKEYLQAVLNRAGVSIAHNIGYDAPLLKKNGVVVPEPWWDTMVCGSLIEPDLPKSLMATLPLYLLTRCHKHLADERGYNDPEYNAKDAWTELRLYEEQWRTLEEWGMLDLFANRIMRSLPALVELKEQGIAVNADRASVWCAKLREDLGVLLRWWADNVPGVDPAKNAEVGRLLYTTWKLPVQRTDNDGWSVDVLAIKTLQEIAPQYAEPLSKLLGIRAVSKLLSTYGRSLECRFRVHPGYLPAGRFERKGESEKNKYLPGTGRLASSDPNIQNQPDDSRGIFETDYPGEWVFVSGDYSQAELRYMAVKSGDRALLAALESGDVHARTVERIGCTRTLAKNGIYGTSYGAGPRRLVKTMRKDGVYVTEKDMREFQGSLSEAYPAWWAYLMAISALGVAQGFLRNDFGRVRRFTDGQKDTPAMRDFPPQSTVGDMGWSTYRDLSDAARSLGGRLSMLVHDEVVLQVPRAKVGAGCDMLRDIMGREFPEVAPGFRIPVNCKVGELWGPTMVKEENWIG